MNTQCYFTPVPSRRISNNGRVEFRLAAAGCARAREGGNVAVQGALDHLSVMGHALFQQGKLFFVGEDIRFLKNR